MDSLKFDTLDLKQVSVEIGPRKFTLREATSEAHCRHQRAVSEARIYNDKGMQVGFRGLAEVEPLLVSLCLLEVTDGGYSAVDLGEIKSWPTRIVEKLSEAILTMSGMLVEETEEELLKQKAEIDERIERLKTDTAKNLPPG